MADTNGDSWFVTANKNITLIPQIESAAGAENAEAIAAMDEVDCLSTYRILCC